MRSPLLCTHPRSCVKSDQMHGKINLGIASVKGDLLCVRLYKCYSTVMETMESMEERSQTDSLGQTRKR